MYLKGLNQVRRVEYARAYLWDLKIFDTALPEEFRDWFPVSEVEEVFATLNPFEFQHGPSTVSVPKDASEYTLSITFFDNARYGLEGWFEHWINEEILHGGAYTAYLDEAAKMISVAKLSLQRNPLRRKLYWVYPAGNLAFHGTSESMALQNTVELRVVGETDLPLEDVNANAEALLERYRQFRIGDLTTQVPFRFPTHPPLVRPDAS